MLHAENRHAIRANTTASGSAPPAKATPAGIEAATAAPGAMSVMLWNRTSRRPTASRRRQLPRTQPMREDSGSPREWQKARAESVCSPAVWPAWRGHNSSMRRHLDGLMDDPAGRAREPAELLDQLRQRLAGLPDGHPSAGPRPGADQRDGPEVRARYQARAGTGQVGVGSDRNAEFRAVRAGADEEEGAGSGAGHPEPGPGDAEPGAEREAGGPDSGQGPPSGGSWPRPDLPRATGYEDPQWHPGTAEAYRPWFMGGEPGVPWFAADGED